MTRLDREVREGLYDPRVKSNYVVLFENKRLGRRDIINYNAYSKEDAERQFWNLFKTSEATILKVAKVSAIYAETHWLDPAPKREVREGLYDPSTKNEYRKLIEKHITNQEVNRSQMDHHLKWIGIDISHISQNDRDSAWDSFVNDERKRKQLALKEWIRTHPKDLRALSDYEGHRYDTAPRKPSAWQTHHEIVREGLYDPSNKHDLCKRIKYYQKKLDEELDDLIDSKNNRRMARTEEEKKMWDHQVFADQYRVNERKAAIEDLKQRQSEERTNDPAPKKKSSAWQTHHEIVKEGNRYYLFIGKNKESYGRYKTHAEAEKAFYDWEHNYDPAPRKPSAWLNFVKAHKHIRNKKGMLDLKGIAKLWRAKKKHGK